VFGLVHPFDRLSRQIIIYGIFIVTQLPIVFSILKKHAKNSYIGDDFAYLKNLGIFVTQDNFIEDIHFKKAWSSPYQIGYKATIVNISDILASGAKPAYLTIGLSLPNVENSFIEERLIVPIGKNVSAFVLSDEPHNDAEIEAPNGARDASGTVVNGINTAIITLEFIDESMGGLLE
jgi:hypothetical protein